MATQSTLYEIRDKDSADPLDARIELDGGAIRLHSRGGATGGRPPRNVDYSEALKLIIQRLRTDDSKIGPTIDRVQIDSIPARKRPVEERILLETNEINELSDTDLVAAIQRRASRWGQADGANGGNGTKAIRIETNREFSALRSALKLRLWSGPESTVSGSGIPPTNRLSYED